VEKTPLCFTKKRRPPRATRYGVRSSRDLKKEVIRRSLLRLGKDRAVRTEGYSLPRKKGGPAASAALKAESGPMEKKGRTASACDGKNPTSALRVGEDDAGSTKKRVSRKENNRETSLGGKPVLADTGPGEMRGL